MNLGKVSFTVVQELDQFVKPITDQSTCNPQW